jgi:formate hydrogenlyase subunit 6/NADH:ubiquinone oxidoreductase subunit I
MGYFSDINRGVRTTAKGLKLTLKHLWGARNRKISHNIQDPDYFSQPNGHVTLQYPHEKLEIPENGRYQLDIEIDDCIVCDKCAKICPVDCIDIEAIKSPELIRNTSDGSPVRLYAAKFDIDMAKCCFCGLCTTVCPTECLTMNGEYDYSVSEVSMLNFAFSNLSPETAQEKRDFYDTFVKEKALRQAQVPAIEIAYGSQKSIVDSESEKGKFVPKFLPKSVVSTAAMASAGSALAGSAAGESDIQHQESEIESKSSVIQKDIQEGKPKFVPKFVPKKMALASEASTASVGSASAGSTAEQSEIEHPALDIESKSSDIQDQASDIKEEKPKFVPKFMPKKAVSASTASASSASTGSAAEQPDIQHPASAIEDQEFKIELQTSEIQQQTSDIQPPESDIKSDISSKKFFPKFKPKNL